MRSPLRTSSLFLPGAEGKWFLLSSRERSWQRSGRQTFAKSPKHRSAYSQLSYVPRSVWQEANQLRSDDQSVDHDECLS